MILNNLWVDKWNEIEVRALYDGDEAKDMEPVFVIEGNPAYFGYLETILLGVMARASSTATSVKKVVKAARGKPVIFLVLDLTILGSNNRRLCCFKSGCFWCINRC